MDAIVGALCEKYSVGQSVGNLVKNILIQQFTRIRSSDRYWYEAPGQFNASELLDLKDSPLSTVIQRNTGVKILQRHVFYADPEQISSATSNNLMNGYGLFPELNIKLWSNVTYLAPYYRMAWSVSEDLKKISFRVDVISNGYVGLGFGPNGFDAMARVDVALGWRSMYTGRLQVDDCWAYAIGAPLPDTNFGGKSDFTDTFFNTSNGIRLVNSTLIIILLK
jgi:hypothetical protein